MESMEYGEWYASHSKLTAIWWPHRCHLRFRARSLGRPTRNRSAETLRARCLTFISP
jgi:hypothetical protein